MILYNVTASVDATIVDEWLNWMKDTHIKEVMATELFESFSFYKVLLQPDDSLTYSVQYLTTSMAKLQKYQAQYAPALQAQVLKRYGEKVMNFRTVLESV